MLKKSKNQQSASHSAAAISSINYDGGMTLPINVTLLNSKKNYEQQLALMNEKCEHRVRMMHDERESLVRCHNDKMKELLDNMERQKNAAANEYDRKWNEREVEFRENIDKQKFAYEEKVVLYMTQLTQENETKLVENKKPLLSSLCNSQDCNLLKKQIRDLEDKYSKLELEHQLLKRQCKTVMLEKAEEDDSDDYDEIDSSDYDDDADNDIEDDDGGEEIEDDDSGDEIEDDDGEDGLNMKKKSAHRANKNISKIATECKACSKVSFDVLSHNLCHCCYVRKKLYLIIYFTQILNI